MKPAFLSNSFFDEKPIAQGTIEYLVIVGVIVVLSLVVVGLVSSSFDSFSNIGSVSSRIAQSSGAISISEAVVDGGGDGLVSFSNNSGGLLIITGISVGGVDSNYSDVSLSQGESKTFSLIDVNSGCDCTGFEGQTKTCEVIVFAESEYGLEKQFPVSVSVDCVPDAVATSESVVVEPLPGGEGVVPLVFLLSPEDNNFWSSGSVVVFDFNVWDESSVNDCSLLINSVDVNGIVPVVGLNSVSFRLDDLNNFSWDVNCVDEWGNSGVASSVFGLSVDANAYQINNCLQLQDMNLNLDGDYVLMNDVNCYDDTQVAGGYLYNGGSGFLPVGDVANKFTGTLDGNYYVVSEIYINRPSLGGVGLFGYTYGASILKVGIFKGAFMSSYAAPLVGDSNNSTISKCYSDVNISTGVAFSWGAGMGGIVGHMVGGTVEESYSKGNIYSTDWGVGGIVGYMEGGTITNCYSTGNIGAGREGAGGIIGYRGAGVAVTVSNSYSTGNESAGYQGYVGGISGHPTTGLTMLNCFTTGSMSGNNTSGLVPTSGSAPTITNSYYLFTGTYNYGTLEEGGASAFYNSTHGVYTGASTWDFVNVWDICEGSSFPTLKWENRTC
ncbi:MAG: GLUG motif-containing protein [archaeon]